MSVPLKYRDIGDFHEYYSGARVAPYLTIFVGGNHEASNHLWELYYGGWVAPRIYYLGAANVIRVGSLRIAGLSGIWKGYNYNKPHYERLPYSQDDIKSIYHVRELDVRKLVQIRTQVDVGVSHDWPRGVEWMGDWKALFAKKDLFEADARAGTLGNLAAKNTLDRLRPPHWFAAHMHCKFAALVKHGEISRSESNKGLETPKNAAMKPNRRLNTDEIGIDLDDDTSSKSMPIEPLASTKNEDEIDLDMDDEQTSKPPLTTQQVPSNLEQISHPTSEPQSVPADIRAQLPASFTPPTARSSLPSLPYPEAISNKTTRFLALDKCLPNRKFLQFLEIDPISQPHFSAHTNDTPLQLSYDKEWLAIIRVFASELTLGNSTIPVPPNKGEAYYRPLVAAEEQWVEENLEQQGLMLVPENFEITAPPYDPALGIGVRKQPIEYTNPQTVAFCNLIGIANPFDVSEEERLERVRNGPKAGDSGSGHGSGGRGSRGGDRRGGRGRGFGRGRGRGYR